MAHTNIAIVDIGEVLSPTYIPDNTAPPTRASLSPIDFAITIHITPILAAVPKDVPIIIDIAEQSKKVATTK